MHAYVSALCLEHLYSATAAAAAVPVSEKPKRGLIRPWSAVVTWLKTTILDSYKSVFAFNQARIIES